jgi:hypothetical protein
LSKVGFSLLALSATAAGVIAQNRFVGFDNAQASAQGQRVKGVADYATSAAGQPLTITVKGTAFVEAGGAFNPGDQIIADAQARGIAATQASDYVKGEALEASSGAGAIVEILLK